MRPSSARPVEGDSPFSAQFGQATQAQDEVAAADQEWASGSNDVPASAGSAGRARRKNGPRSDSQSPDPATTPQQKPATAPPCLLAFAFLPVPVAALPAGNPGTPAAGQDGDVVAAASAPVISNQTPLVDSSVPTPVAPAAARADAGDLKLSFALKITPVDGVKSSGVTQQRGYAESLAQATSGVSSSALSSSVKAVAPVAVVPGVAVPVVALPAAVSVAVPEAPPVLEASAADLTPDLGTPAAPAESLAPASPVVTSSVASSNVKVATPVAAPVGQAAPQRGAIQAGPIQGDSKQGASTEVKPAFSPRIVPAESATPNQRSNDAESSAPVSSEVRLSAATSSAKAPNPPTAPVAQPAPQAESNEGDATNATFSFALPGVTADAVPSSSSTQQSSYAGALPLTTAAVTSNTATFNVKVAVPTAAPVAPPASRPDSQPDTAEVKPGPALNLAPVGVRPSGVTQQRTSAESIALATYTVNSTPASSSVKVADPAPVPAAQPDTIDIAPDPAPRTVLAASIEPTGFTEQRSYPAPSAPVTSSVSANAAGSNASAPTATISTASIPTAPIAGLRKKDPGDTDHSASDQGAPAPAQAVTPSLVRDKFNNVITFDPQPVAPASDTRTPDAAPASPAAIQTLRDDLPKPVTTPLKEISLQVGNPGEQAVQVRLSERAGELRIAVRSADPAVNQGLTQNLQELTGRLTESGYRSQAWHPASASQSAESPEVKTSPGQGSNNNGQQQGGSQQGGSQQGRGQQQQNSPNNRPRWVQELESNLKGAASFTGEINGISS